MAGNEIDELQRLIRNQFRRDAAAPAAPSRRTREYANWRLAQLRPKLGRVTRKNAYQHFLLEELQAEAEKFRLYKQADDDDNPLEGTPYEELRDNPVCTCNGKLAHRCEIKRGRLPREVRTARDLDEGIRKFRGNHDGRPVALLDAQDAYWAFVGDVEFELRAILSSLASDEIPADTDWPEATDGDGTAVQPAD